MLKTLILLPDNSAFVLIHLAVSQYSYNAQSYWQRIMLITAPQLFGAVVACGLGCAEGARLSQELGSWQVISWALVLSLPIMLPLMWLTWPKSLEEVSFAAWASLIYIAVFSMFIGFLFCYRGLALGGIAAVGQLQLMQPFMGLMLAALLLHEMVSIGMLISTLGAVVCVVGAKKFSV
ncbi:hypothetical protein DABAL43B_0802 [Psychrobacter sp. DAB_AL43B]|nr:hypothetical protein DABAL43B_0802 [Psychrobacter sp. DAB_AL43B]